MTTEPRVPTGDYRWRAADLVVRKSERALAEMRGAAQDGSSDANGIFTVDALIEETERALEMASRALAEHQTEEN